MPGSKLAPYNSGAARDARFAPAGERQGRLADKQNDGEYALRSSGGASLTPTNSGDHKGRSSSRGRTHIREFTLPDWRSGYINGTDAAQLFEHRKAPEHRTRLDRIAVIDL